MSAIVDEAKEHADSPKRSPETVANMFLYLREICFFLSIVITSYAAIHNSSPPIVSHTLPAVPFFNTKQSQIIDFYNGELNPAFEKISESDLTFAMYYAPWDAESQAVRAEFELLASYFENEITFVAVNCWHPNGDCRRHFSKVHHFPVMIAYPSLRGKGIQYRGIKKASHMARFLKTVLRPLVRVENSTDVLYLLASHDAVTVSCVDLSRANSGYQVVYSAALKALETDPYQEVAFSVATSHSACSSLAPEEDGGTVPALHLYLWNETLSYHGEWNSDKMVKWIFGSIHQVAVWVTLPGTKSMSLAPYIEEGPALLMFTPRNPFLDNTPYFELLREIGLEYYNCNDNSLVTALSQYLASNRESKKLRHRTIEKSCLSRISQNEGFCSTGVKVPSCATVTLPAAINFTISSKLSREKSGSVFKDCSRDHKPDTWRSNIWQAPVVESLMQSHSHNSTSITIDPKVLLLGNQVRDHRCKRMLLGRQLNPPVFPKSDVETAVGQLKGLSCSNNRSLSLLALDSLEFDAFARHVGVDTSRMPDKTAVVILNAASENHNLMSGPISKVTLSEFLMNHTKSTLPEASRIFPRDEYQKLCQKGHFCLTELNSTNFLSVVMNEVEDVVVLYHSPLCGMCGSASLVFLTVANLFRNTANIRFVRVDGENNDLPWQYAMESYPTILFFPANRKAESRVFPKSQPITLEMITHFVLANLRPESRLQSLLNLHGSKNVARLHTLLAIRGISYFRPTKKLTGSPLLQWRRLKQRSQYLRLLHLALLKSRLETVAMDSLQQYYRLSPSQKLIPLPL